ncbi:MAG: transglycosylase SLT domain-containing protein [Methylophilaceae bacterium]
MVKWFYTGCALLFAIASFSVQAYTGEQLETFENEPPVIRTLLEQASRLDKKEQDVDAPWKAAKLYCEASRYGSAEGLYRLGMFYAFGRGVPKNRDYAANLFGLASMHGHFEAQKMLETIELRNDATPACVLKNIAPEKAPFYHYASDFKNSPSIEVYIKKLPKTKRWVVDLAGTISEWYNVDAKLVLSIIMAESNFKVAAKSNKDAHGLMQLIPATAERFNVKNAYNASQNIKGGVAYLRWLLSYYRGSVPLAVAAYNAGEGAVDRHKGIPPYKETRAYVKKVLGLYQSTQHSFDANITKASSVVRK